jgi:hypothetical protein
MDLAPATRVTGKCARTAPVVERTVRHVAQRRPRADEHGCNKRALLDTAIPLHGESPPWRRTRSRPPPLTLSSTD